jgi:hypothetical protein
MQETGGQVRERGGAHPDSMDFGGAEHGGHDEHAHLPPPSIWPITMALGIAMGFGGIVLDWEVSALGGMTATWAFVNWIQELRHETLRKYMTRETFMGLFIASVGGVGGLIIGIPIIGFVFAPLIREPESPGAMLEL